tara:strand:- start:178 stop:567 length:390 start_codon:yes stop_codon:yes gene_type:complete
MRTGIGPQNLGLPGGKPGHTPCGCRKPEVSVLEVEVSPLNKMVDVDGTEVDTDKPGMSNAGKYKDVPADDFAGPHGTYPINTEARGKSAIKLAHNAANPEAIKAKVYKKYPELKPEIGVQSPSNNSKTA